jgi:hypothetical protein
VTLRNCSGDGPGRRAPLLAGGGGGGRAWPSPSGEAGQRGPIGGRRRVGDAAAARSAEAVVLDGIDSAWTSARCGGGGGRGGAARPRPGVLSSPHSHLRYITVDGARHGGGAHHQIGDMGLAAELRRGYRGDRRREPSGDASWGLCAAARGWGRQPPALGQVAQQVGALLRTGNRRTPQGLRSPRRPRPARRCPGRPPDLRHPGGMRSTSAGLAYHRRPSWGGRRLIDTSPEDAHVGGAVAVEGDIEEISPHRGSRPGVGVGCPGPRRRGFR